MNCSSRLAALICVLLTVSSVVCDAQRKKPKTETAVEIPAVQPCIIPVSTDHSQWILSVDRHGILRTLHYGAKVEDPEAFLRMQTGRGSDYGNGPMAWPTTGGRFTGTPALHVRYADGTHNTELYYLSHEVSAAQGVVTTRIRLKDYLTLMETDLVFEAYPAEDVIQVHSEVYNGGKKAVELLSCASASLELEAGKYLLTHTDGGWAAEMQASHELLGRGVKLLETRRGTQATQDTNPSFLLSLDTDRFSEEYGEVVAGALAWSGNFRISFEMGGNGRVNIVSGIQPFASAYPLASGQRFETPRMIYTWSAEGAGGASRNMHRWARHYGIHDGGNIHPTLLNSWEGAYFNFTTQTLLGMIDDAAAMGLEMFVLDDGWFGNNHPRNSDNAGLGDWEVNETKLPEGIDYIADYAHGKGLKFGIWIEPEMVNPASDLAEAHPEWIVRDPRRPDYLIRNQSLLDLSNPAVQDFVFGVFDRTVSLSDHIDYIKWDCNRSVENFYSTYLGEAQDRFFVDYVQGLYKVLRRVREKYPHVLVQCCSSGGARVDYGAMRFFDEFWTSDNTDAVSRVRIQYGTSLIYPACAMAAHVSIVPNHQTGSTTSLKFRFDMASAGRLGMELQPRNLSDEERALADRCIRSYKSWRDVVFGGDLYRLENPYEGDYYSLMYVSEDRSRAVVFVFCLRYQDRAVATHALPLRGLDPSRRYRVTEQNADRSCWWGDGGVYSGSFLGSGAFNPAVLRTNQSAVFYLQAE